MDTVGEHTWKKRKLNIFYCQIAYKEEIHSAFFLDLPWHAGYTDKVIGGSWIQPVLAAESAQTGWKADEKVGWQENSNSDSWSILFKGKI